MSALCWLLCQLSVRACNNNLHRVINSLLTNFRMKVSLQSRARSKHLYRMEIIKKCHEMTRKIAKEVSPMKTYTRANYMLKHFWVMQLRNENTKTRQKLWPYLELKLDHCFFVKEWNCFSCTWRYNKQRQNFGTQSKDIFHIHVFSSTQKQKGKLFVLGYNYLLSEFPF